MNDASPAHDDGGRPRVAIVGSIDFPRPDLVAAFVASLPDDALVVSGGAPGVDSMAETAARARGLDVLVFMADWKGLGRKAGPIRNARIVEAANQVVAFWNGSSRGTLNTVVQAVRAGKKVRIIGAVGQEVTMEEAMDVALKRGVIAAIDAAAQR